MFKVLVLQQISNPSDDQMRVPGSGPPWVRTLSGVVSRGFGAGCEDALVLSPGSEVGGNMEGTVFGTVLEGRGWGPCGTQEVRGCQPRQRAASAQRATGERTGEGGQGSGRVVTKQHRHKDRDVRWTRKRNENHHGNKNLISVDREPGPVRRWQASDAAYHDSRVFARVPGESSSSGDIRADSACYSRSHEALLAEGGWHSRIPRKEYRNRPLSARSREASRKRSKVQAAVEHVSAQPRAMGGKLAKTVGLARAHFKSGVMNPGDNLRRLARLEENRRRVCRYVRRAPHAGSWCLAGSFGPSSTAVPCRRD